MKLKWFCFLHPLFFTLSSQAQLANYVDYYSCLDSLSGNNIPGQPKGELLPLGTPTNGVFLFEVLDPNITPETPLSPYTFDYDSSGKSVARRTQTPETPSFSQHPGPRNYLIMEKDKVRVCSMNSQGGEMNFLLVPSAKDSQRVRVSIKNTLNAEDRGYIRMASQHVRYTSTPCSLFGSDSCYLDREPRCHAVEKYRPSIEDQKTLVQIQNLLRTILAQRLENMPREQQRTFTLRKNMRSCDHEFLQNYLRDYKEREGLTLGNTASEISQ